MILLDTSVCVPLVNGKDRALARRVLGLDPVELALCSVVKAELVVGAYLSADVAKNLDRVLRFCEPFASLPFDDESVAHYGRIRADLQRRGRPIGANDLSIAAIALARGAHLATRNVDEFRRVPGLKVEAW